MLTDVKVINCLFNTGNNFKRICKFQSSYKFDLRGFINFNPDETKGRQKKRLKVLIEKRGKTELAFDSFSFFSNKNCNRCQPVSEIFGIGLNLYFAKVCENSFSFQL